MLVDQEHTQNERLWKERLGHSLVLLIVLDLATLGLYSIARGYVLHSGLSQKAGRQLFSLAFLNILMLLNLMIWIRRFSRGDMPLDANLVITRLGATLLLTSLLLVFRRFLQGEFGLRIRPLPLALFGFWYLQQRINQLDHGRRSETGQESWVVPTLVLGLSVTLSLLICAFRIHHVAQASMEPALVPGDYVLVDQLSPRLFEPLQRGDILVVRAEHAHQSVQIKRLVGLPGDRLDIKAWPGAWSDVPGKVEVPADHYLLMSDHPDNSADSRTHGAIPSSNVLGLARMTLLSYQPGASIPWERWFHFL